MDLDKNYMTHQQNINMRDMLHYVDFTSICEDYDLTSGDITPTQTLKLERLIEEFINQNK